MIIICRERIFRPYYFQVITAGHCFYSDADDPIESIHLYVDFWDRNILYDDYMIILYYMGNILYDDNPPAHEIPLNQITYHHTEDIALVYFDPYDDDANEIIRVACHIHQNHEMYYTIGHGLISYHPSNTADILQGTSTISFPRIEYNQHRHRSPLSDHEVASRMEKAASAMEILVTMCNITIAI